LPDTIKVFHFHNGTGGGVLSVIRNLLLYKQHDTIENHIIYTINKEKQKHYTSPGLKGAASEQIFYYSPNWNFYYTCKQLAKLLPDEHCLLVAHDWLELGMISNLGLQNPVVQFLHGYYDYYFNLAKKHEAWIDAFICIAAAINEQLQIIIPSRSADIHYCRFPVPEVAITIKENKVSKILFAGRCEKGKGSDLLPAIAQQLKEAGEQFEWHIVGEGAEANQFKWPEEVNVTFHGVKKNEALLTMLSSFDYFILPSLAEGMPIAVIEAMKAGVIPVVNDLPGGLQEIVMNEETGFRIKANAISGYTAALLRLEKDQPFKNKIASAAIQLANDFFQPQKNTAAIEEIFISTFLKTRTKKMKQKVIGSRLDTEWMPNKITTFIRKYNHA
jgi:glycosyltransferase involved in cell wall biosynthesis